MSNNVFGTEVKQIEDKTDNLIYGHSSGIMQLNMKILGILNLPFSKKEKRVPLSEDELNRLLLEGQNARLYFAPNIKKI